MTTAGPYRHLLALGDDVGLLEHAEGALPRREAGYCVDDAARLVVCACREPGPPPLRTLADRCLALVRHAVEPDGRCRNRLGYDRRWRDDPGLGDWWGRAVWALGEASVAHPCAGTRFGAGRAFVRAAVARSPHRRALAYAALGAVAVLVAEPADEVAAALLRDAVRAVGRPAAGAWPWPEARLGYANAVLPEALIAGGAALGDEEAVADGCALLAWLVATETRAGHFSVTPAAGWGPGEPRPGFDQQPLEVAHLASACTRAFAVTGEAGWRAAVARAAAWFTGANDVGVALADPETWGCADGLESAGVNRNQGAESTLALVSVWQCTRALGLPWPCPP